MAKAKKPKLVYGPLIFARAMVFTVPYITPEEHDPLPGSHDIGKSVYEIKAMLAALKHIQSAIVPQHKDIPVEFPEEAVFALKVLTSRVGAIYKRRREDLRKAHKPSTPRIGDKIVCTYTEAAIDEAVRRLSFFNTFPMPAAEGVPPCSPYENWKHEARMIAENSERILHFWNFPPVPCDELRNGIALEWSWINGKEIDLDDELRGELNGNSLKIVKLLADGRLCARVDLDAKIWDSPSATDDRLRKAIDRLNVRLVGGDLDRFGLEIAMTRDHVRLIHRK